MKSIPLVISLFRLMLTKLKYFANNGLSFFLCVFLSVYLSVSVLVRLSFCLCVCLTEKSGMPLPMSNSLYFLL